MKLKIALIRNGKTEKAEGKTSGASNDSLSEDTKNMLRKKCAAKAYPVVRHVYSSELLCCRETANLIYSLPMVVLRGLDAPDYDDFNGQAFLNVRSINVIREIGEEMEKKKVEQCAIIAHKMAILAILRRYCVPRSGYTDWEIPFGGGYLIEYDTDEETAALISTI